MAAPQPVHQAADYLDVLAAIREAIDIPPAADPAADEQRCALLAWRAEAASQALADVISQRHIPLDAISQLAGRLAQWQPGEHYRPRP